MARKQITDRDVRLFEFQNQENNKVHVAYSEDMKQFELLRNGDPQATAAAVEAICSPDQGKLSDDPLRNIKYLFVSGTTIATRVCIAAGLDEKTAFNISDLHIQAMDKCQKKEEVVTLFGELFTFLTIHMQELRTKNIYSKPIVKVINYIYDNLHYPISARDLALEAGLNPSYLSTLFKKETGMTISDYILGARITQAQNMLKFSDYSISDIAVYLSFSSQSYFIRQFKKITGMTPKEYRNNISGTEAGGNVWKVVE